MLRLAVDVGGTFTDLVLYDEAAGRRYVHKVSSTPDDPARAIVGGATELCEQNGLRAADISLVFHGTTVATNMMIERDGSPVGLITTHGFRDLVHIARKKRPLNFSHSQVVPWQARPIARRRHRLTVRERIAGPTGEVVVALDEDGVRAAARRLAADGIEAVAVCFLFSFLNPEHERRAAELVRELMPNAFVSASHEVVPLYREYERFNTTLVNVFIGPRVANYLRSLSTSLRAAGIAAEVRLMTSAGGVVTDTAAAAHPVSLLMSGPAAGLLAGVATGRSSGHADVITLDVGGTSSDIGVAADGQVRMKHLLDTKIQGDQVMVPMADIETIGAGGGSIAAVSAEGVLEVGPRSAGAVPGPACYGRGGTEPTTTDAAAVLGWLRPKTFFGGRLGLDLDAAAAAVREHVALPLGLDLQNAALGIHTVVTHNMANAINQLSIRRGIDPREFDLVAQGGAGPLFACAVGAQVQARRIVIPPRPGLASAFGLLETDLRYEGASTVWQHTDAIDLHTLAATVERLTAEARAALDADGVSPERQSFQCFADCRYPSQGYELRVNAPSGPVDADWVAGLTAGFHDLHYATYRSRFDDRPVHLVNLRVVGVGAVAVPAAEPAGPATEYCPNPVDEISSCFRIGQAPTTVMTRVYEREALAPGAVVDGPAVIEQPDSTTVIEPGFSARVDEHLNLIITAQEAAS